MGRKAKYTFGQKVQACGDRISGRKNAAQIAHDLSVTKYGDGLIRRQANTYRAHGPEMLLPDKHDRKYSKEFRMQVDPEYMNVQES